MAKKPWEKKVVENNSHRKDKITRTSRGVVSSTSWITAFLSAFFVIVVAILFIVFYTSNRGEDRAKETSGFYGASSQKVNSSKTKKASTSKKTTSSSKTKTSDKSTTSSSTVASSSETSTSSSVNGGTIVVQPGEGAASIAARAGISVARLQELNPGHMTSGYWYANPGDPVVVN
ncbi:TPA: SAG1386/EF1546 family surface-associated protein [Streptococcus agalactiae]|uniref:SAG1386/EF1546 family surface-associated protein n=1 Tax=Streptococcus agalactiae TaxID=1311 RepID=UPI0002BA7779|nr:SAG1386/EF1546 family surface-associated protein [Streptococcus agalactiae]EPU99316.1 membrane protein [Streptococcus agalactiae GB00300]EPW76203.1 membrane protein [Streptococcus agalactiae BSU133]KLL25014.1 membrane protein [Streptococcus agalactiae]MCY7250803.1 LysM peptidoglycan-binding domain-containing protein [Streptococcus agalactiae]TQC13051.1 LysM domain-containing protein [Streptococcus agalactiae]